MPLHGWYLHLCHEHWYMPKAQMLGWMVTEQVVFCSIWHGQSSWIFSQNDVLLVFYSILEKVQTFCEMTKVYHFQNMLTVYLCEWSTYQLSNQNSSFKSFIIQLCGSQFMLNLKCLTPKTFIKIHNCRDTTRPCLSGLEQLMAGTY